MLVLTCHPPGPQLPIMSHWRWSRADWDEMPGPGPGAQWHQPADTGSWTAWAACTLPPHTLGTYTLVTLSISEELAMITWSWSWKTFRWCHCDQRVWCSPHQTSGPHVSSDQCTLVQTLHITFLTLQPIFATRQPGHSLAPGIVLVSLH